MNVSNYVSNLICYCKQWDELCFKSIFVIHQREKKKKIFQGTTPKKLIWTFRLSFLTTLVQQAIVKILPLFYIVFSSMAVINGILNPNETMIFELFWYIKVVFIKLTAGVIASKREVVFAAIIMDQNTHICLAVAVSFSELLNIQMFTTTRRFHSNLLNQTFRLFLVFESSMNLNNLMSSTRSISKGKKLEKAQCHSILSH